MEFIIGGVAGAGATIFTNPMDVVKTRMQLQGEMRARKDHVPNYKGFPHALYVIAKKDGLRALQKGLVPAMLHGFTMNSVRLGLYHVAEVQGWFKKQNGEVSLPKAVFWSSLAGGLSGISANPPSVVKTRIQAAAHPSIAVGRQHQYDGTIHGFQTIYRTEGIRGFFVGVNATCVRIAVGSMAQLSTFSTCKEYLLNRGYFITDPASLAFVASILTSVFVACLECPLDVVNTRLYNQGSKENKIYSGFFDCFRKIYKSEGVHGFYKGFGPLYFRIAPHTTISLVIWDMLNILLLSNKKN